MKQVKIFKTMENGLLSGIFECEKSKNTTVAFEKIDEVVKLKKRFNVLGIAIEGDVFSIQISYLKELINAIECSFILFPVLKGKIRKVYLENTNKNTVAKVVPYTTYYDIVLNEKYWFMPNFRDVLAYDFRICNSSTRTISGAVYHEIIHPIEGLLILKQSKHYLTNFTEDWNNSLTAKRILNRFGFNEKNLAEFGDYANKNYSEALAEILSCVMSGEIIYYSSFTQKKAKALFLYIRFYLLVT